MIRDQQRAPRRRHMLDALGLHPEPVAVVEVEDRLDPLEDALGAPPVVDVARRVGLPDEGREVAQLRLALGLVRELVYVGMLLVGRLRAPTTGVVGG